MHPTNHVTAKMAGLPIGWKAQLCALAAGGTVSNGGSAAFRMTPGSQSPYAESQLQAFENYGESVVRIE